MKELLQQWAELEPERCRDLDSEISPILGDKEVYVDKDWMPIWDCQSIFSFSDLQVAVQEAIETKTWLVRAALVWHYKNSIRVSSRYN